MNNFNGRPKLPKIKTPIPGPKSRAIFDEEQRHVAPGRQRISLLAEVAFDHGDGATLTDADGNTYLDFFAGVAVAALGHGHPGLAQALAKQASRLIVGTFATAERAEVFRLLSEAAPAKLTRAHLYSGGAEAVEAAIRLAKSETKHHEVVSFWGGFHGKTSGVMGLIGDESKQGYGPLEGARGNAAIQHIGFVLAVLIGRLLALDRQRVFLRDDGKLALREAGDRD